MKEQWEEMADSLRDEVAEYGRLLHLYEEQQKLLFKRDAAATLRVTGSIEEQMEVMRVCRGRRREAAEAFARSGGATAPWTLISLVSRVPEDARPLLKALVTEMNRLVGRLRRVSRHNRMFLIRTIENHQEVLRRLRPGCFTKTYSHGGHLTVSASRQAAGFSAEG